MTITTWKRRPWCTRSPPTRIAFVQSLAFLSTYQLAHTPKTAPDVPTAFGGNVLATIQASPKLGGAAIVTEVNTLIDTHGKLTALAEVLGPLVRLVGQNFVATDAALAKIVGDVLSSASRAKKAHPELLEHLAPASAWTKLHHPGHGTTPRRPRRRLSLPRTEARSARATAASSLGSVAFAQSLSSRAPRSVASALRSVARAVRWVAKAVKLGGKGGELGGKGGELAGKSHGGRKRRH